jgi:RimJ/RimL family protein N-acetyltransferase
MSCVLCSTSWTSVLGRCDCYVEIHFRSYRPDDRTSLVNVIDLVCAECPWMITRRFEPTPAWSHALSEPDCPHHLLLVAEQWHIFGWCRLLAEIESAEAIDLGIGLLPDYRQRGIGVALLQSALNWATSAGYQCVTLSVHPDNFYARHVFERCGFQYGARNPSQLVMVCDL